MASGQQWINTTQLRDRMGVYSHAMPIVVADVGSRWGLKLVQQGNIGILIGFTIVFAQGCSVPISRGSPPISG